MNKARLGFESLLEESGPVHVPVSGTWPRWLEGALLSTGPALFEFGQSQYRHWFDGLAMLYRFAFRDGTVQYTNRFLHSRGFDAARAQGRIVYGEFATPPDTGVLRRLVALVFGPQPSDNANINVIPGVDGAFALTETPTPVAFHTETLATIGPRPFQDGLKGQLTTAHPQTDPAQSVQVNYLLSLGRTSVIQVFEHSLGSRTRRQIARLPVDRPSYMHSFGLTNRHVVLIESPLRVHPLRLRFTLKPFIANYRWHDGEATRFRLVDRADGSVATVEGPACFAYHHANAFDDGDAIAIDLCAYADASIVDAFAVKRLRRSGTAGVPSSRLIRYRLPKAGGRATTDEISAHTAELPRINNRVAAGRRYKNLWAASKAEPSSSYFDRLVRIDVENGAVASVWEEPDCFVGEPVFIPRPGGIRETDGIVVSVVLDGKARRSVLLALQADTLEEMARAQLPHVLPFHFHGRHVTGAEVRVT